MTRKLARIVLLLGAVAAVTLLAARCARPPSLSGLWRDTSPAALLYEFRDDGSVWLVHDGQSLPVFRYDIAGDVVEFHDGMGRPRAYRFALDGDRLTLQEVGDQAAVIEYRRE